MFMRMMLQPGAPEFVGVADDVLRVRRAFEPVHDDGCGPRGADLRRLPVAVAENLARDLVSRGRRDLDQLCFGSGKVVGAAAESCPTMVCRWPLRKKRRGVKLGGVARDASCELRCLTSVRTCFEHDARARKRVGVERAGGFVFVLEVDEDVALLRRARRSVRRRRRVSAAV